MGLGNIVKSASTTLKIKAAEIGAKNLAEKADEGAFGSLCQKVYRKTKGYKSVTGLVLFLIIQALGQFTPPNYDCTIRYLSIAAGVLTAAGLLDRARRNEPLFDPALLAALQAWTLWIGAVSTSVLGIASSGVLDLLFPGHPGLSDQVNLITTALTTATAFVNRWAQASATPPKPVEPKKD